MTPNDKKLVLLKILLGRCEVNAEQQMNVENTIYVSLKFKKKNLTIQD